MLETFLFWDQDSPLGKVEKARWRVRLLQIPRVAIHRAFEKLRVRFFEPEQCVCCTERDKSPILRLPLQFILWKG